MVVEKLISEEMKIDEDLCFITYKRNYSQLSTSSKMTQKSTPTIVYQRGKQRKNFFDVWTLQPCDDIKTSDACPSPICSQTSPQEHLVSVSEDVRLPIMHPVEEAGSEEAFTIDASDNGSSSKLNMELHTSASKIDADESSSSCAMVSEKAPQESSQNDVAVLILKSQDEVSTRTSKGSKGVSSDIYCSTLCKICDHMDSTLNMLICDSCEDAFHVSCCNPLNIPYDEWFCSSCLKRKRKIFKDKSASNVVSTHNETGRNQSSASEDLGSLEFMFKDTEPYVSKVHIGDEFQADVPDWCGPVNEVCDLAGETLEFVPSHNNNMQELDSMKPLKLSSVGNWLQCKEVIGEGDDETICGKWRRAPLFEVQTDNWECFRCVLWDPVHADCAVPQELDTEEVMKQLKYIEMLKPRLAAKRRKLNRALSNGSQDVSGKDKHGDTTKKSTKLVRSSLA